jgi:hypothetical protein
LRSVPLRAVKMAAGFWQPRLESNLRHSLPSFLAQMEEHGVVDNFRRLSGRKPGEYQEAGYASESDLYKWLEAVGLALQSHHSPSLQSTANAVIDEIVAAQGEDGYLYARSAVGGEADYERFSRLRWSHELYCAGHLIQAGIAYWRGTGEDALLGAAIRYADYLCTTFGPGKIETTDGHPEIELALAELYRATGEQRYLDLAGFFLSRPQSLEDLPPIAQRPALVGHAVRSAYICCGGADWVAETGDEAMLANLLHLGQDLLGGKIYLTGGVGARHEGEAFGEPYELPNARAYAETCAAISHQMWAWRMLLLTGDCQWADLMETILYNGFLSGVALTGDHYYYMNPLASDGGYERWPWHQCNCCPPNVQRTLAALPGYIFSTSEEGVWVHLYDACEALVHARDHQAVRLEMRTRYPWEGTVEIVVTPPAPLEFTLFLRLPGWAESARVTVDGQRVAETTETGCYLEIRRVWKPGETVRLELPLTVELIESHPRVTENYHRVALQRGPLVYCVENHDNPTALVPDLAVAPVAGAPDGGFRAEWQPDVLRGVALLRGPGQGPCAPCTAGDPGPLYRRAGSVTTVPGHDLEITAIPYYAWGNRGDAVMRVWLPRAAARLPLANSDAPTE